MNTLPSHVSPGPLGDPAAAAALHAAFPDATSVAEVFRGDVTVDVDPQHERAAIQHARDTLGYTLFIDRFGDDLGEDAEPRFAVLTVLYNLETDKRLHLRTKVSEDVAEVDSLVPVFRGADWFEREIYDMFGLTFRDHPDLRRILLPDHFPDHPLRKDYPLEGRGEFSAPRRALGGNVDGTDGRIAVPERARAQREGERPSLDPRELRQGGAPQSEDGDS